MMLWHVGILSRKKHEAEISATVWKKANVATGRD